MTQRPQSAILSKEEHATPNVCKNQNVYQSSAQQLQRPSSSYGRIQRIDTHPFLRSNNHQLKRPPSRNSKIRSPSPSLSSKEFLRAQTTNQDKKTLKRIREYQQSYLPPHTCNVFYQNGRNAVRSIQCKRCSMTFSQSRSHSKPTSNTQKLSESLKPKKASKGHEFQSNKENLENISLPFVHGENDHTEMEEAKALLKDNIKQLLYFYRDEQNRLSNFSKGIQTAFNEEYTQPKSNPKAATNQYEELFCRSKRVELFDDDEYLRLMKEYGVDCEPSCFQFEGSSRTRL